MKKTILFLLSFLLYSYYEGQIFTEQIGTPFDGVANSSIAFADIDGDTDLDVLITGDTTNQGQAISKLYTNNGSGVFTEVFGTPFEGVSWSSVAFADVDGDGDMDVLTTGAPSSQSPPIAKLYTNDGTGVFTELTGTPFQGVSFSSIKFADIDGDTDLDVLISGNSSSSWPSQNITKLYTNDGSGNYSEVTSTPFQGVSYSSIAFADIDGDSDMDLLISGNTSSISPASPAYVPRLYSNDGNGLFTELTTTPFQGVRGPSVAFADVDGDADMDLLIAGSDSSYRPISKLYNNDGNGLFTEQTSSLFRGASSPSVAFADIDNDTDMDVLIIGDTFNLSLSRLYTNDGTGVFTEDTTAPFEDVSNSSIAFADVDGDGDVDVLIAGNSSNSPLSRLYINGGVNTNIKKIENKNNIKIFPNPARNELTISNIKLVETITIYNSVGQIVKNVLVKSEQVNVDVSKLPSGVYLVDFKGVHNNRMQFIK
jgi:predicted nucleotidyltransferase